MLLVESDATIAAVDAVVMTYQKEKALAETGVPVSSHYLPAPVILFRHGMRQGGKAGCFP